MIYLCLILAFFIQLPSAQQVCADGYERVVGGDVPMFGEINGKGGRQVVSSCAMCANLCDDEPLCNSYECDTADEFGITCNLNQEAESTTTYCGPICQRQLFCVKQTPTEICADGYDRVVGGDVPMFGEINGKGGRQVVSSCAMCANLCDDESLCNSYECDTADEFGITCNLNQEAQSTTTYCGPICQRQLFCVKQTPTPAEIMYKALKGCSRNRFHAFQEELGFYDPSTSVAKIQCCSLDGSTCTRKDSWPHGACLGDREKVTWAQAKQICEAEGMRLCNSQQEVDNCCHRGCGYDGALTWTGIYPGVGSHYAACGRPGRCNAASIVSEDIAFQKVRCVSDSRRPGWFSRPNLCGNISWESDIWGGCHSLTFQAATEFCASQDARLPTREEAESGCVAASGCGFDAQYIWTSTSA